MKLYWQNENYVEILEQLRSDAYYRNRNLDNDIKSYQQFVSELAGRPSNSDDIFKQVISQIKNGHFRKSIKRIHADVHFWQAYMKFNDAIDGEYENINYNNDNVTCDRYYDILTFFVISHMDCPLAIEQNRVDFEKWIEIRAQIQEDRVPIDPQGTYQHMLGGLELAQLEQVGLINIVRYYNWLEDMRDFLNAHYHEFDLFKQERVVILMGSSGVTGFNRSLAFAAEINVGKEIYFNTDQDTEVGNKKPKLDFVTDNSAIMKFANIHKGALELQREKWRIYSPLSKQIFLHINVCQSSWDRRYRSAVCTIRFINELIEQANAKDKPLAIVDLRVPQHVHLDNANRLLKQDQCYIQEYETRKEKENLSDSNYCHQNIIKTNDLFKLVNIEPFSSDTGKGIVRLGNTSSRNLHSSDILIMMADLKALYSCGYPIDTLYQLVEN